MGYEAALSASYGTGLYHAVLTLFSAFTIINTSFEYHAVVFMQFEPDFRCSDDSLAKHASTKWITEGAFSDLVGAKPISNQTNLQLSPKQCWALVEADSKKFAYTCRKWNYSKDVMTKTVVSDLDLVCAGETYSQWLSASLLMGAALGHILSIFTGGMSRRRIFFFYIFWEVIFTIIGIFGNSVTYFFLIRLLRMLAIPLMYVSQCIIHEALPTEKRALFGNAFWGLTPLGPLSAAAIAYGTRNWFSLRLYGLALFLPYIPLLFLMPESPRELVLYQKWSQFEQLMRYISHWNRGTSSQVDRTESPDTQTSEREDKWQDIFRLPNTRAKALTLIVNSSASYMAYYGLSMNPTAASPNIFLNMVYLALAEIPAGVIGWMLTSTVGRRPTFIAIYIILAPCLILSSAVQSSMPIVSTTLVIIGRLAVAIASNVSSLCITECYPTSVRNYGLSITMAASCALTGLVPFINALAASGSVCLPGAIYACFCLVAGMLVMVFLPETKYCPLAQTLAESEQLSRGKERQWIEYMQRDQVEGSK